MIYTIPDSADRETLAALHNDILQGNPDIRVHNRWGSFSEYSIKVKRIEVEQILAATIHDDTGAMNFRVVFGWDDGPTYYVEFFDRVSHGWQPALVGAFASVEAEIAAGREATTEMIHQTIIERVTTWLREHHPAAEALVEIDRRLLA